MFGGGFAVEAKQTHYQLLREELPLDIGEHHVIGAEGKADGQPKEWENSKFAEKVELVSEEIVLLHDREQILYIVGHQLVVVFLTVPEPCELIIAVLKACYCADGTNLIV